MNSIYAFQSPSLKVHPLGSQGNLDIIITVTAAMTNKAAEVVIQLINVGS